ncbi:MAG: cobalamin B12-binding domain-containing protein [Roseinatronobacter sp.]|jgi:methylmalonyl-CoA mutase cobalamin-binding subunit|nr:cobalamin B12-binding domain-containing protein [Roseinatronobacter sp.]
MDGRAHSERQHGREVTLSLRSFAMRVVSELRRSVETAQRSFCPDLAGQIVAYARSGDQSRLSAIYSELQRRRVTADEVMDVYLPHAVTVIGHQWHEEEIDILHASMACARMQTVLREIGHAWVSDRSGRQGDGRVLLTLPVGEQHTLGAMLAANQLRRRGVSVKVMLLPEMAELRALIERNRFHAVFISVSNLSSLTPCAAMVRELRMVSGREMPIIIGGGLVSNEIVGNDPCRIAEITGADLVTNDIDQALHSCGIQQISAAAE